MEFSNDLNDDVFLVGMDIVAFDTNDDGVIDSILRDTDGDGIVDTGFSDTNQDGFIDTVFSGRNQDGIIDEILMDMDGDHIFETNSDDPYDLINSSFSQDDSDFWGSEGMDFELYTKGFDVEKGVWYPPTFDPNKSRQGITGDPADSMEHWHMQTYPDTCAVVSQEFILEDLTGKQFDEDDLRDIAIENGWYTPGGGTAMEDVGNLLEYYGLDVTKHEGSSISEIERALTQGDNVIVGLNSEDIWIPGQGVLDRALNEIQGIPGNDANHAVEVIGIDRTNLENPMVILNDPGHPGGEGSMIPLDDFEMAWSGSNNFIVIASA